jgi:hypothetical protein
MLVLTVAKLVTMLLLHCVSNSLLLQVIVLCLVSLTFISLSDGDYMYELRTVSSLHAELKNGSICASVSNEQDHAMKKSKSDGSLTSATGSDSSIYTVDELQLEN